MNFGKCHLILSSNDENKKTVLNGEDINNTQMQKLLRVLSVYKLKFDTHIESLCKKVGKKLHSYKPSTNINEKFYNVSIELLSTHWMCHSRKFNNQIYKFHVCALRLVYNDKFQKT